jgi:hypothetical protein
MSSERQVWPVMSSTATRAAAAEALDRSAGDRSRRQRFLVEIEHV